MLTDWFVPGVFSGAFLGAILFRIVCDLRNEWKEKKEIKNKEEEEKLLGI